MLESNVMEARNGLALLRELTGKLPELAVSYKSGNMVEYGPGPVDGADAVGFGLYKNDRIAIQRAWFPAGSILAAHQHEEKEWVIIYSGEAEITFEGKTVLLKAGDSVYFAKHQMHSFKAIKSTWVLGVTVPAAEVYPDAN